MSTAPCAKRAGSPPEKSPSKLWRAVGGLHFCSPLMLFVIWISCTVPYWERGTDCGVGDRREVMGTIVAKIRRVGSLAASESLTFDVAGLEGAQVSLPFPDSMAHRLVSLQARDRAGNRSCLSPERELRLPTAVGYQSAIRAGYPVWIDVAGRRYTQRPTNSGVYWEMNSGTRVRKLVLLK